MGSEESYYFLFIVWMQIQVVFCSHTGGWVSVLYMPWICKPLCFPSYLLFQNCYQLFSTDSLYTTFKFFALQFLYFFSGLCGVGFYPQTDGKVLK